LAPKKASVQPFFWDKKLAFVVVVHLTVLSLTQIVALFNQISLPTVTCLLRPVANAKAKLTAKTSRPFLRLNRRFSSLFFFF